MESGREFKDTVRGRQQEGKRKIDGNGKTVER